MKIRKCNILGISLLRACKNAQAGNSALLKNSRGVALTEAAIVFPFLIILFVGIFDLGSLLNQYLLLTNAVNSGARYAMGISNLKVGTFEKLTPDQVCPPGVVVSGVHQYDEGHREIQQKVFDYVKFQNVTLDSDFCMASTLEKDASDPTRGNISIALRTRYDGVSPLFSNITLEIRAKAPYMMVIP